MIAILNDVEAVARHAVVFLLNGFWQSLALVLLVSGLLWAQRRLNAATCFVLWMVTLGVALSLPLLGGLFDVREGVVKNGGSEERLLEKRAVAVVVADPGASGIRERETGWSVATARSVEQDFLPIRLPPGRWPMWILGIWAAGAALLLLRIGRGYVHLRQFRNSGRLLSDRFQQQFGSWMQACGLRRIVSLCSSREISTPMVVGLRHPVVLLPEAIIEQLGEAELEQIGLHELAHIRRWDDWNNLLQKVVEALFWPLPAVWWISRQLDIEREIACDDWVVDLTGKRRSYAACLIHLVELNLRGRQPLLAAGAALKKTQIATRVRLLVEPRRCAGTRLSRIGMLSVGGVVGMCAGLLSACDNPFAPDKHVLPGDPPVASQKAISPEILLDNLHLAMRSRDRDLYESLIDERFWFTEYDCRGDLVGANGREKELEIMGTRDGSSGGIFDRFRTFEFDFQQIARDQELGREYPRAYEGDPDGHPEEDWEMFRGRVQMMMLDEMGDGYRVDQIMVFKLRQDDEDLWKIIRWDDDPLSGDCGAAKSVTRVSGWGRIKAESR